MDAEVQRANEQLRLARSKARLWQKEDGGVLYLRATLPSKPKSGKDKASQQTIPLRFRGAAGGAGGEAAGSATLGWLVSVG